MREFSEPRSFIILLYNTDSDIQFATCEAPNSKSSSFLFLYLTNLPRIPK